VPPIQIARIPADGVRIQNTDPHTKHQLRETEMITQFHFIKAWLAAQAKTERGASLVEYALLVALIAVVCIGAVTLLAGGAEKTFSNAGNKLNSTP